MRVTLIAVQSIDGYITQHGTPGAGFASVEDAQHLRNELRTCDATIMGANTFRLSKAEIAEKIPPVRLRIIRTRDPVRYKALVRPGSLEFSDLPARALCEMMRDRGIKRCGLLGGTQIYTEFLSLGLVDEVRLTVEPVFFGAGQRLANGELMARFNLTETEKLSPSTLLLTYRRA